MTVDAKQVAKELERRARRRKLIVLAVWAALIVAAAFYLRCGRGWGTGGKGPGAGGTATGSEQAPKRCAVRVSAEGITVDGKPATRDEAVAQCKATAGADVVVTGDARHGDWDQLRLALDDAKVPVFVHEAR